MLGAWFCVVHAGPALLDLWCLVDVVHGGLVVHVGPVEHVGPVVHGGLVHVGSVVNACWIGGAWRRCQNEKVGQRLPSPLIDASCHR